MADPDYKPAKVADLIPYARNSRTHSDAQVAKIAASIKEFGFLNPVITDGENGIIAGHGRILAAQKLGLETVPTIEASHLSEAQRRAYVIADNRLALDAGWDDEMLRIEIADLEAEGFNLSLTGFDLDEINSIATGIDHDSDDPDDVENYTRKIEAPIYEPKGEKPKFSEIYDRTKTEQLISKIESKKMPQQLKDFLISAAERHTIFHFDKIAEFYCHATAEVQEMMEESALVIIDYDQAVENGFVEMSAELLRLAGVDASAE